MYKNIIKNITSKVFRKHSDLWTTNAFTKFNNLELYGFGYLEICIETCGGIKGYGYTTMGQIGKDMIDHHLKEFMINQNIEDIPEIFKNKTNFYPELFNDIKSGIELALWDTNSKTQNKHMYELTSDGSNKEKIPIYVTLPYFHIDTLKETIIHKEGIKGVKICLPFNMDEERSLIKNIKIINESRDKVPNKLFMIDCYTTFNLEYMTELINNLDDNIEFIEEPFPLLSMNDIDNYVKLKKNINNKIKIASGEHLRNMDVFEYIIKHNIIDVLQPDIRWLGINNMVKISNLIDKYNSDIQIIPHVGTEYSYHFVKTNKHSPMCEFCVYRTDNIFSPIIHDLEILPNINDGYIYL